VPIAAILNESDGVLEDLRIPPILLQETCIFSLMITILKPRKFLASHTPV